MSNEDKPHKPEGEGTILRPNPGLRRPPTQPLPPYPQQGAPSYPPGAGAPRPVDTPFGRAPASPFEAPGSGAAVNAQDDWITTPQQPGPRPQGAALQRAEDLNFDDLAAQNENPIMRAAGPLLQLLGRLRVAALRASLESLMGQVAAAVDFFERDIRSAGISPEHATAAKYLICATADDIVQNIPTDDRHIWAQYSMTSRFFGERLGGVNFFRELERLRREPSVNFNVLELQHACLALGFQGQYRSTSGGPAQLQQIQRDLYETLRRVRPKPTLDLSPRWRGQNLALHGKRLRVPLWVIASVAAALLLASFFALRTKVSTYGAAVASVMENLYPASPIALQGHLVRVDPPPAPSPQRDRIKSELGDALCPGSNTKWIKVCVGSSVLFASGKAEVLDQFRPIADKIAKAIEKESGPVKVVGYTDNTPLGATDTFKSNRDLSIARARAVADLLRPALTDATRLAIEGRGENEPMADNKTPDGRSKNRRVEVWISRAD